MFIFIVKVLFTFTFSFLVTFYLVPIFCTLAHKFKIIDTPDGYVKKHLQATPYLGGLAVYMGFLFGLALTFPFENRMFLFLLGSTLLLLLGLIDDLIALKPYQKFFGQMISALCFLKAGFYLKEHLFYNYWNIPFSFLWIMSIINAFNLVDVMDGLASLIAITASFSFLVLAFLFHHEPVILLLTAFLGALIAFFYYNRPQAVIYLGDSGALFIGGVLAIVPFLFNWGLYNINGYITPVIILAIPLLEIGFLIILRTIKGIPFYKASPDHFSIYLQKQGMQKMSILYIVFILSVLLFFTSCLFVLNAISLPLLFGKGIIFLFIWIFLIFR